MCHASERLGGAIGMDPVCLVAMAVALTVASALRRPRKLRTAAFRSAGQAECDEPFECRIQPYNDCADAPMYVADCV